LGESRVIGRAVLAGLVLAVAACGPDASPSGIETQGAGQTATALSSACLGGVAQATCDEAQKVALVAVAGTGWTPTHIWVNSGSFCPREDCLFDPTQNFPYPLPPSGGTWVANVEIAFAGTDKHAGLHIARVGSRLVPVLIGYRAPLPGWCSGNCP
jgi:hypothetical protein